MADTPNTEGLNLGRLLLLIVGCWHGRDAFPDDWELGEADQRFFGPTPSSPNVRYKLENQVFTKVNTEVDICL